MSEIIKLCKRITVKLRVGHHKIGNKHFLKLLKKYVKTINRSVRGLNMANLHRGGKARIYH